MKSSVPENSFQKIFWEQQKKASALNNSRSMKWHPLMVKWCLYLKHLSSKAYETIRDSGCIALPSQRTLRDCTHAIHATSGFSSEVDSQLIQAARIDQIKEWEKCVVLVMDEMYIKEDLVYNKHTGKLVGFSNLGDTNTHLLQFQHALEGGKVTPGQTIAKTMLVFMVRGFFIRLQFPFAQFPCTTTLSGDQMYDVVWEAMFRLERIGFKVLAVTADGASTNRLFFKLHKPGVLPNEISNKVFNPFSRDGRQLYFFSDPPHLIKTVRNAWENKRRPLWVCVHINSTIILYVQITCYFCVCYIQSNGKPICWQHLEDLYLRDRGAERQSPGLCMVPKLKYEHLHLTSFSKMRVDLAAQVC